MMSISSAMMKSIPLLFCLVAACSGTPRFVTHGAQGSFANPAPRASSPGRVGNSAEDKRWAKVYHDLLGTRYIYGGSSRKGFDCSGLVQYAFLGFDGRQLPRTVNSMFNLGRPVPMENLRAGDLVFFNTGGRHKPSHVGIYLNNRQFLHSSVGLGVEITSMDDAYYSKKYAGARRLGD